MMELLEHRKMIVTNLFQGDSKRIADIQHDVYGQSLVTLFTKARIAYRTAESVLDVLTELGEAFSTEAFDHRTLQWLHDAIAGKFRFTYCIEGDLFENKFDVAGDEDQIIYQWRRFLDQELDRLFKKWIELPRQIGMAACFPNPDPRGVSAEDWLYEMTLVEYTDLKLRTEKSI